MRHTCCAALICFQSGPCTPHTAPLPTALQSFEALALQKDAPRGVSRLMKPLKAFGYTVRPCCWGPDGVFRPCARLPQQLAMHRQHGCRQAWWCTGWATAAPRQAHLAHQLPLPCPSQTGGDA